MHTLPLSFALFTYTGYWRPVNWSPKSFKYWMYNASTVIMVSLLHTFAFCGLMDSFLNTDLENFVAKFSLFMSVLGVCCKVSNLLFRRGEIIDLINMLLEKKCIPRNKEEMIIQNKFDRNARTITIYCEILNESAVFFATFGQYHKFLRTRTLPLSDWTPYELSSDVIFWLTLLYQTFALIICANASVAHETLISGLMIQTCAQFEILCHRIRKLPSILQQVKNRSNSEANLKTYEKKIIQNLVQHHLHIYRFAKTINTIFTIIILVQFSVSSTVLCLSVYKMSSRNVFDVDFLWSSTYLACMLMQVYLYCWFGNEVTLKSIKIGDVIFDMDWTDLRVNVVKDLITIMLRTRKPIIITSGHIITLSAESFMTILKISYSTYNILQNQNR